MQAYVVIGAGFGDEGKGLTTDYLAAQFNQSSIVVRFNGGAQAAHTVQTSAGERHVFKHFGSGSLVGSASYLSEFFICNPILFHREWDELAQLNINPQVFVHANAMVTTPYDMMINQIIEEFRAQGRHGSCGLGINETVERNSQSQYTFHVRDLLQSDEQIRQALLRIQQEWVPKRLAQLGIEKMAMLSQAWQQRLSADGILEYYLAEIKFFIEHCQLAENGLLQSFDAVIFEGAQGLLLDEEKGFFPYVTRSFTGLRNVLQIARDAGISHLKVFYITRAYLTRHGAGPLPFERDELRYAMVVDKTNVDNQFQGSLRFAPFNFDLLKQAIAADLMEVNDMRVDVNLMITCVDQLISEVEYVLENQLMVAASQDKFIEQVNKIFPHFIIWISAGATRNSIKQQNKGSREGSRHIRGVVIPPHIIPHI